MRRGENGLEVKLTEGTKVIAASNAKDNNAKVWLLPFGFVMRGCGRGGVNGSGSALSKVVAVVSLCFGIATATATSKAI